METRDRILDSAQRLIQTRSFHGFSFQDVADEVGLRKASLYHHFDSKDGLAIAMLDRAAGSVSAQLQKADSLEPAARLDAYLDMYRVIHGKGARMCPGGSFAAALDATSESVQRALHNFTKLHIDWLEGVVRDGVERQQFKISGQRPRDVALQILATIQGALLVGRMTSDPHALDLAGTELRTYLGCMPKTLHV